MKKVITFGTFDIFHKGHESYLKQAKKYGDYLIVVVARDANVLKIKGALPKNDENERLKKVKESGLGDEVVLGNLVDRYQMIKKHRPDVICAGYDQQVSIEELTKKLEEFGLKHTKVVRLKAHKPEIYKSSKLKISK